MTRVICRQSWVLAAACAASLVTAGCYTSANGVSIPPFETRFPVSASPSYLANDGSVVDTSQYHVVRRFSFQQWVSAPRHAQTITKLELGPKLDQIVSDAGGDAATNVRIRALEYDPGDHAPAASLKQIAWLSCIPAVFGLTIGGISYARDSDDRNGAIGLAVGGTAAIIGGLSLLLASFVTAPTQWHIEVSGAVVQTKWSGAPQPAPQTPTPQTDAPGPGSAPAVPPAEPL
jgi:hypothetical protein